MFKRLLRNSEFRVNVVPKGKNEYVPDEVLDGERNTADVVYIAQGVGDVVANTAVTIFTLAAAYKLLDTVCKVVVKKI